MNRMLHIAMPQVQDDIVQQLGFGASSVRLAASFDRPNIRYCVRYADTLPHEVLWDAPAVNFRTVTVHCCSLDHLLMAANMQWASCTESAGLQGC
jgi:superfamily II DNA helicase RecQ